MKKWVIGLTLTVIILLFTWKRLPVWLLMRDEPVVDVPAAFVLMGSVPDRTLKAYELLHEKRVPRLVFVRDQLDPMEELGYNKNGGDATFDYLRRLGANDADLEYLADKAHTSTREEAETLVAFARQRGWRRVALVTSWYHTARATWVFRKVAQGDPEIIPVAATSNENRPDDWWRHEPAFLSVFVEYLKWIFYLVMY